MDAFSRFPDELVEAVISHLTPQSTVALGRTSRRHHGITARSLVWRRHCIDTWRFWHETRDFEQKLSQPPAQVDWHALFNERKSRDHHALLLFNALLEHQSRRHARMHDMASMGNDVKDLLLRLARTADDADDHLARKWHADAILLQQRRQVALATWHRLQQGLDVPIEAALGSFDLFLGHNKHDLDDISAELDRIAQTIREDKAWEGGGRSARDKALLVVAHLRDSHLVGNPDEDEESYHALRNNFISLALFEEPHSSLPLQSVAIFCAVARRLGIKAGFASCPGHVHALVETQPGQFIYLDPWGSSTEVPVSALTARLDLMGLPPSQHDDYLGAATTLEICLRTSRNLMNSVHSARLQLETSERAIPNVEHSWYGMLWAMLILCEHDPVAAAHRRRQVLGHLIEKARMEYPEDLVLLTSTVDDMFGNNFQPPNEWAADLVGYLCLLNEQNLTPRPPQTRTPAIQERVHFRVGQTFRHIKFGYQGFVIGWDAQCNQSEEWISNMNVDKLLRGREQAFYNIIADDRTQRYVAQENIQLLDTKPSEKLVEQAGQYFKRLDESGRFFVSNLKDEYPSD